MTTRATISLGDRQLLLPVANVSVLAQPKGNNGAYDRIPIPVGFSVHSFGRFDKGIKGAAVAAQKGLAALARGLNPLLVLKELQHRGNTKQPPQPWLRGLFNPNSHPATQPRGWLGSGQRDAYWPLLTQVNTPSF